MSLFKMIKTIKINFALIAISFGFAVLLTSMLHVEHEVKVEIIVEPSAEEKLNETIHRLLNEQYWLTYQSETREKGEENHAKGQYYKAIVQFYRSKTSNPSNFSSRVKLAEIFTEYCTQKNRYCGNAQREIKNAFSFSEYGKQSDIKKLLYLEKIMKKYVSDFFKK